MSTIPHSGSPSRYEVETALTRILNQPEFQSSTRLCEFLRFIVYEALAGRTAQLKAYTIAMAVYGRDETFDAQSNSIVRVEATRLRRLLDRYYAGEGADDPIAISIPRGGYTPEFAYRDRKTPQPDSPGAQTAGTARHGASGRFGGLSRIAVLLLAAAALTAAGFWSARFSTGPGTKVSNGQAQLPPAPYQPTIQVEIVSFAPSSGDARSAQDRLAIEHALDRFEDILVVEQGATGSRTPDYRLRIIPADPTQPAHNHIARVVHSASGEIVWSQAIGSALTGDDSNARQDAMHRIAEAIARPFGVIFSDQRRRLRRQPGTRYGCLIESSLFFARPSQAGYESARRCTENAVKAYPQFGAGIATLSLLYVRGWQYGFDARQESVLLEEVNQLAQRSQLLKPESSRSNVAVFMAEFYRRNYSSAFKIGDSLIKNSMDSPFATSAVAAAHATRGDVAKAKSLLTTVSKDAAEFTTAYGVFLFVIAYAEKDAEAAERWAMRRGASTRPLGLLARIMVNHQRGRLEEASRYAKRLQEVFPAVFEDVPTMLKRYRMAEPLYSRFLADLQATGLLPSARPPAPHKSGKTGGKETTAAAAN